MAGAQRRTETPQVHLLETLAVIVVIASTVFGALINICEGSKSPLGDLQDVVSYLEEAGRPVAVHDMCFGTILRGSRWSFVKIITAGRFYGDCIPVTPLGKLITVVVTISGIITIGLLIASIRYNLSKLPRPNPNLRASAGGDSVPAGPGIPTGRPVLLAQVGNNSEGIPAPAIPEKLDERLLAIEETLKKLPAIEEMLQKLPAIEEMLQKVLNQQMASSSSPSS